jgi:hypothetical protein
MLRQPIYANSERPSFFDLLMADSCFQRARNTANPGVSNALRDIGRNYLVKATEVTSSAGTTGRSATTIVTRRPMVGS